MIADKLLESIQTSFTVNSNSKKNKQKAKERPLSPYRENYFEHFHPSIFLILPFRFEKLSHILMSSITATSTQYFTLFQFAKSCV